jgi:hypothetical protein
MEITDWSTTGRAHFEDHPLEIGLELFDTDSGGGLLVIVTELYADKRPRRLVRDVLTNIG